MPFYTPGDDRAFFDVPYASHSASPLFSDPVADFAAPDSGLWPCVHSAAGSDEGEPVIIWAQQTNQHVPNYTHTQGKNTDPP
ncbi:hypothetical protein DIPPA_29255 [Diplonema papillatum]|nr:hypothetical protein DIPPA_29255 [Diplonema papillatum]